MSGAPSKLDIEMSDQTPITLHVRGPLRVETASGARLDGLSRKGQALLSYLALAPAGRAERATLADLLWSDRGEAQARASLRQELSTLKKALPGDVVEANRQQVWLRPGAVEVDRTGAGDLLEGFDLRAEGFEDWLRSLRQSDDPVSPTPPQAPPLPSRSGQPTLAVMPFRDLSPQDGDTLARGIVEDVTSALSHVRDFDVIARQSALRVDEASDPVSTARTLGADYVVEGSVRRDGDRVRVAASMTDGRDGHLLWSERFDDRLDDLFDLQDRIAARVAGQLSPRLRDVEIARAGRCNRDSRSAYEIYLTALPLFWAHQKDRNRQALDIFDLALERDPDFGPALAHKGWALAQQPSYMWSDDPDRDHDDALALARRAADRALDHAPTLVALSAVHALSDTDPGLADHYARRAVELDPSNAWGWMRLGWALHFQTRNEEAIEALQRAMDLSPLDPFFFNFHLGKSAAYRQMGDYEASLREVEAGFRANPGITWAHRMYVGTYTMMGRMDDAVAAAHRFREHYPHISLSYLYACWPRTVNRAMPAYYGAFEEAFRAAGIPE